MRYDDITVAYKSVASHNTTTTAYNFQAINALTTEKYVCVAKSHSRART